MSDSEQESNEEIPAPQNEAALLERQTQHKEPEEPHKKLAMIKFELHR